MNDSLQNETVAVILAAGQGKRMNSKLPKVMHKICGKPMVGLVYEAVMKSGITKCVVVVGYGAEYVQSYFGDCVQYAVQEEQLGTGHAVKIALSSIGDFQGNVIVINGDMPFIQAKTIRSIIEQNRNNCESATIVSAELSNPEGLGRVLRKEDGSFYKIVEQKDTSEDEKRIKEINTGAYCFNASFVLPFLEKLRCSNAQNEYYLTDVFQSLAEAGNQVSIHKLDDYRESLGVNDRVELTTICEMVYYDNCIKLMRESGVTIIDPHRTYIDSDVIIGRDTVIYPGCFLEGNTVIGENVEIGPNCRITDSVIGDNTKIDNSIVIQSTVANDVTIGPFAYLRPKSVVADRVKIGDFVELKNASIGVGTKIPHLSYIGDAVVGENTNIGCGVITCNYDGKHKYQTQIGNNVFVGSNSNLIAPVSIQDDAYIASGSTITDQVPEGALGIARARQVLKDDWVSKKGLKRG